MTFSKIFTFVSLVLFLSLSAHANVVGKIQQVSGDKSRALVKINPGTQFGSSDKVSLADDCELEVLSIKESTVVVSTKSCLDTSKIKVGAAVDLEHGLSQTPAPTPVPAPHATTPAHSKYSSATTPSANDKILSGFLFAGVLASQSAKVDYNGYGYYVTGVSTSNSESLGIKFGYASVNDGEIGWITHVTLANKLTNSEWSDYSYIRPDISMTYGRDSFFGLLGINLLKYNTSGLSAFNPGLGYQLGFGFTFSEHGFMEVQYIVGKITRDDGGYSTTYTFSAPELTVGFTF